jgi:carotenoid cleavage dioxygenase-like enzyme
LAEGYAEAGGGWNQGNFAPVKEETAPCSDDLKVEGTLPLDLAGVFARVGPNPKEPAMGNYHWFDGDGMVHAVRIQDGRVTYTSHWVQTSKLLQVRLSDACVGSHTPQQPTLTLTLTYSLRILYFTYS